MMNCRIVNSLGIGEFVRVLRFACIAAFLASVAPLQPAMAAKGGEVAAKPGVIPLGHRFVIRSKLLKEDREILVRLPAYYDRAKQHYPVLIVLDGGTHFLHASGVVDFLSAGGRIPEMIVIAVPTMQRRARDLTAPLVNDEKAREDHKDIPVGGGAAFANFLADEVMPWVDSHYRTAPYRVLMGHSLGGLFNFIALLDRPDAFQAHIAVSPSLWWDKQAYVTQAEQKLGTLKQPHFLFMSWGDKEKTISESSQKLVDWMTAHPPAGLTWKARYYPGDDHGTTPHRTLYDGLSALYEGWLPDSNMHDAEDPDYVADKDFPALLAAHQAARSQRFGYDVPLQPTEADTLVNWLIKRKRLDEALVAARRNAVLFPEYSDFQEGLGKVLTEMGRHAEALPHYEAAINDPGEYSDIWSDAVRIRKLRDQAKTPSAPASN